MPTWIKYEAERFELGWSAARWLYEEENHPTHFMNLEWHFSYPDYAQNDLRQGIEWIGALTRDAYEWRYQSPTWLEPEVIDGDSPHRMPWPAGV